MSSVNITEVEGIMRMGVNQESELNSLLTYYRNKVEDCNRERQEWIAKYDECKFDADLKHKLQWENRHLKDKIEELQRQLSHHKTALYDQRQNYLRLIRQNTEFKKRQGQDARKIQELLEVCEPHESATIMCKDVKPELTNTFIANDLNIHKSQNGSFGGTSLADRVKSANSTAVGGAASKTKKQKSQTYLPPQQTGKIQHQSLHEYQIANLKKQFDAEMGNLYEQNTVLKEELQRLRQRNQDKFDNEAEGYKDLLAKHSDLQNKHSSLAQQYFSIRMKLTENEQRIQQSNQLLRVKNLFLAEKLKQQQRLHDKQAKAIEQLVSKRNADFKTKYKQQMRKKEQHLSILKQQYQKIQQIYLNKIKSLEQHLSKLNDKYNDLGKKSKREIAYLQAQLKVMQKRVESEQVQKMRLQIQQLQEQERRKIQMQQNQQKRLRKQRSDKKQIRQKQIQKAYGRNDSPNKSKNEREKVSRRDIREVQERRNSRENRNPNTITEQDSQQDSQDDSIEVNSRDIDNIQKHIQDLQQKLGLK